MNMTDKRSPRKDKARPKGGNGGKFDAKPDNKAATGLICSHGSTV
jgi:hypothetical protein